MRPSTSRRRAGLAGTAAIAAFAFAALGSGTTASAASGMSWPKVGQAAVLVDGPGAAVVSSPQSQQQQPIASVAKVMTAYQVLIDHRLGADEDGPTVTVLASEADDYRTALLAGQTVVRVAADEKLTERQALEAMLLPSANDMARILARWDGGGIPAFVARENATAARLGMTHTHYADPAGIDPNTVSTAADQVLLAKAAMSLRAFARVVGLTRAAVPVAGTVQNSNPLLGRRGVVGVKSGWTTPAGACLMVAVRYPGAGPNRMIYVVVLGQPGSGSANAAVAAARLIDAAWPGWASGRRRSLLGTVATGAPVGSETHRPRYR